MLQTSKTVIFVHHVNVIKGPNSPSQGKVIKNSMTKLQAIHKTNYLANYLKDFLIVSQQETV